MHSALHAHAIVVTGADDYGDDEVRTSVHAKACTGPHKQAIDAERTSQGGACACEKADARGGERGLLVKSSALGFLRGLFVVNIIEQ